MTKHNLDKLKYTHWVLKNENMSRMQVNY